jgi:methylenetetrahydrofolate reductase (NADPH)
MQIRDLLGEGCRSFSFEFFPPKNDEAAAQLERTISDLRELQPTFVTVTYGAGGSTREKTIDIVSRIKRDTGIEAMAHLTCVGSTKQEIQEVLARLVDAGIENILALRGDPPKGEKVFMAVDGGFSYASQLVGFIRELYGHKVSLGGAGYPEKHVDCANPAVDLEHLKEKVDQGLDFITTQLFFDNRVYFEFVDRARAIGIKVPIIPGIMPIMNASQAERFGATLPFRLASELHRRRHDAKAVHQLGVAQATSQCMDLLMGGAPGIHFYTMNRSTATREIFAQLKATGFVTRHEAA